MPRIHFDNTQGKDRVEGWESREIDFDTMIDFSVSFLLDLSPIDHNNIRTSACSFGIWKLKDSMEELWMRDRGSYRIQQAPFSFRVWCRASGSHTDEAFVVLEIAYVAGR